MLRFISVISVPFEMENKECDSLSEKTGRHDQESAKSKPVVNVQSPSQTLLERLTKLRKWQENQREALLQVQLYNPVTTSITHQSQRSEGLTTNWDVEAQTTKDSVYSPHKKACEEKYPYQETKNIRQTDVLPSSLPSSVPHKVNRGRSLCEERVTSLSGSVADVSQDTVNSYQSTLYTDKAAATWPSQRSKLNSDISLPMFLKASYDYEKSEVSQTKSSKYNEVGYKRNLTDKVLNSSRNPSIMVDNMQSHNQSTKLQVFTSSQVDETSIDNFFEKKLTEKTENEIYHSEKCESRPPKLKSSIPEVTPHTIPKPKHRYLRKGEGTARFGMKAVRFKKTKAPVDEKNLRNTITSSANGKSLSESFLKINVRKPVNRLHLRKIPSTVIPEIGNSVDRRTDHKATLSVNGSQASVQECGLVHHQKSLPKPVSDVEIENQSFKEREELSAFEKLEELAEDSSFSSNSSTVLHLLQCGQQLATLNPFQPRPSFKPQETPVIGYSDQQRLILKKDDAESTTGNRTVKTKVDIEDFSSHCQQSVLSASQVLEQLRTIVRLEDVGATGVSEAETKKTLGSLADECASLSPETMSHFASGMWDVPANSTSTPAHSQTLPQRKPHVHFRSEGVEVLEYELSETDGDDTLTDAPSIIGDDSDLVTTSDLEALALLNIYGPSGQSQMASSDCENKQYIEYHEDSDTEICSLESVASSQGTPRESRLKKGVQPITLQFSPPRRPKHSSSNYIWSIFGKERSSEKNSGQKKVSDLTKKNKGDNIKHSNKSDQNENESVAPVRKLQEEQAVTSNEVETYKALLLAKICELEKETKIFKRENSKLQKLQQVVQEEKKQLNNEKQKLQDEVAKEKRRLQEYIDCERNSIWKEKQELKKSTPSITTAKEHSLEIVYLKEQIHDMQEEAKKKASLHQFSIKKLNEKIKVLEEENKQLKNKNLTLQDLEKENLQLKHKLDRTKLNKKPVLVDQAGNIAKGKFKPTVKTATINSINRSLDRMARSEGKGTGNYHETKGDPSLCKTKHVDNCQNAEDCNTNFTSGVDEEMQVSTKETVTASFEKAENNCSKRFFPEKGSEVAPQQQSKVLGKENQQFVNSMKETHSVLESRNIRKSLEDKNVEFTEFCRDDGTKEIIYANGNKKEVFLSGLVIVSYYNGDKKEIHSDRTVYVYGTDLTSHTTFNDGKEVLVFPNGQKETRLPDGSSEIVFTDNSRKVVLKDGTETCFMKNGTIVRSNPDGSKVFEFVSGQREIHTVGEKRREYPDGTVKILHQDGRTETHYKTGRTRIKDCEGNIIIDTYQGVP